VFSVKRACTYHVAIFKRQLLLQTRLARRRFQKISPACSEDFEGFDAGDYHLFHYCHNYLMENTDPMGITDQACRGRGAGVVDKKALRKPSIMFARAAMPGSGSFGMIATAAGL
jgi:hypothetical protein